MRVAEVANRYAKALFDIGQESQKSASYYEELRAVETIFNENEELKQFALSPLVKAGDKEAALTQALEKANASKEISNFLLLLARKGRLGLIHHVVVAFQNQIDAEAGVVRGSVRTAHNLAGAEQEEVRVLLGKLTDSDVILDFSEDENLVAGLTAQVGSLTIDDSIQSHLNKIREELNRSVH